MKKISKLEMGLIAGALAFGMGIFAWAQTPATYLPNGNTIVKLTGQDGSYHDANFYNAVANAVNATATPPCPAANSVSIASGFGTNAAISQVTTGCTVSLTTGTTASSNGVIALPAAAHGWICTGADVTTSSNAIFITKETATNTVDVTLDGFQSNGAAGNWVANDVVSLQCNEY